MSKKGCQNLPQLEKLIPWTFSDIPEETYQSIFTHCVELIQMAHDGSESKEKKKEYKSHCPGYGKAMATSSLPGSCKMNKIAGNTT